MLVHEGQPPLWMMILLIAWRWLNVASMLAAMVIRADLLACAPEGKVHVQCADRPVCRQPVCVNCGVWAMTAILDRIHYVQQTLRSTVSSTRSTPRSRHSTPSGPKPAKLCGTWGPFAWKAKYCISTACKWAHDQEGSVLLGA